MRKRPLRAVLLPFLSLTLIVLALVLFQTTPTQAASGKGHSNAHPHAVNLKAINGNPFTVQVGADGSIQIENALDPISPTGGQFYPPDTQPGDAGIFLVTGSKVFGPDFVNHGGTASNTYDLFTQVSQSAVTGSGTAASPFTVVTVLDVPGTAIRVTQTSTYVNGATKFNQSWAFSNNGNGQPTPAFNFFYAGDIYFQGSDSGYGYYDVATGAVGGFNQANTAYIIFIPTTRSNAYYEGPYHSVWDKIGSVGTPGSGFGNSIDATTLEDNGAGLQWNNRQVGITLSSTIQIGQGAAPPPLPYIYALPFLANQAGGYTSYIAFQNPGNVTANLYDIAYDSGGFSVGSDTTCPTLAAHAECIPPNLFAAGASGTGIIASDQPLNVVVAQSTPYGGSAYAVSKGGANSLVAPLAIRGAIGFTTGLTVFNAGASPTTAAVAFYDAFGNHVTGADKSFSIASHASQGLYQGAADSGLPDGFYGWAQVTGPSDAVLTAQTVEQNPASHFVAIANAQPTAKQTLYAPAIFKQAFGSFTTGANIVNPNSAPVNVTVTYYNGSDGTPINTAPFSIPAHGVALVYQGGSNSPGLPTAGLPAGFNGSAIVNASAGGVVMVVNEAGATTPGGFAQSGTYAAAPSGSNSVGLPVIANGGYNYITGATILNTSAATVSGSVQYYNVDGTPKGTSHPFTAPAFGSALIYQGGADQGLTYPFYGTAIVTETGGGSDLIVTTNAQSNLFFYTYTEPN